MTEEKENTKREKEDVLLIAEVKAYLAGGETLALLPFKHEEDVRAEVNKFMGEWAKSGFLLKGNAVFPWHQVKSIEVVAVQAMTHAQAAPYLADWSDDTEAQKLFWKTRKSPGNKAEEKEGE